MKAAVFHKPYAQLKVEDWEAPVPGAHDVLIRVAACGVCHTDLHFIDHGVPPKKRLPMILGHEITGVIEQVGDKVADFSPGERVLVSVVIPCEDCKWCQNGHTNLCRRRIIPGNSINGGYAEYVSVSESGVVSLPDELPLKQSAVIADAFGTSYHAIHNIGKLSQGEKVAILGCGGLGAAAIQIAKQAGAYVIGLDMNPLKLDYAREMGADEVVDTNKLKDLGEHIREMTQGGVDLAVEAIGAPRTIYQAFTCLGPAGKLVVMGYTRNDVRFPAPKLVFEERSIHGVLGCPVSSYQQIFKHALTGEYDLNKIVTKEMPLDEIEQALNSVRSGQTLRTIIVP